MGAKSVGWERRGWQRGEQRRRQQQRSEDSSEKGEQNGEIYRLGSPDVADSRTRLHLVCTLYTVSSLRQNYRVQIVLLVKFNHALRVITAEKWEKNPAWLAQEQRQHDMLPPFSQCSDRLSRSLKTSPPWYPVSYNVARGALLLGLRLLFLRDLGPGERDIVSGVPELETLNKTSNISEPAINPHGWPVTEASAIICITRIICIISYISCSSCSRASRDD